MISLRLGSVMSVQLPDEVFGKSGYGVGIARQPGDDRRQHQTIAGRQAGAALTLEPDLHAAQTLQHAGQPARDAVAGQTESRVPGPALLMARLLQRLARLSEDVL